MTERRSLALNHSGDKKGPRSGESLQLFPVQYSTLSSEALEDRVLINYYFPGRTRCEYLYRGLNDNYLVRDSRSRYILRVYRHNWRNLKDIESELELLNYLKSNGISISFPLADKEGDEIQKIHAPEGVRYAVLFSYAKGESPLTGISLTQSRSTGRELAKMHALTVNRHLKNNRCHLDVTALLYESFHAIRPYIEDRKEDVKDFEDIIQTLRNRFESISLNDLSFGICHGDLYPSNFHISPAGKVTLFDFDACCCSWFAMDVAAFCYATTNYYPSPRKTNRAFVEGYEEIRGLKDVEKALIPHFGAVNHIWVLATQCSNFEIFCHFVRANIKRNIIGNLKKYVEKHCH